jgi:predicted membrane chloride channel (bestrophin family)
MPLKLREENRLEERLSLKLRRRDQCEDISAFLSLQAFVTVEASERRVSATLSEMMCNNYSNDGACESYYSSAL